MSTPQFYSGQHAILRLEGTSGNDYFPGTPGDDEYNGLGGDDQIGGMGGNDTLLGGDGNDYIYGEDGNDGLKGGAGPDTSVFKPGNEEDRVQDFRVNGDAQDIVDMTSFTGTADFADLKHHYMHQDHDDVVIRVGDDDVLTLIEVRADRLHAQNFLFA